MSYQRKKYVGRAEKLRRHKRVYRLIWLFGLLALAVWLMFNYVYVYDRIRFMLME